MAKSGKPGDNRIAVILMKYHSQKYILSKFKQTACN